ncbi:MAG: NUDIX domain-containing protein [Nocardioides sp.]|nr:NUDIX domain-containing protein [Nocardioides sp.]
MHYTDYDTRVSAYALIIDGEKILLTWYNGTGRGEPGWALPGGGMELGESFEQTVAREVKEETGYDVEVGDLLVAHVFSDADGPRPPRPYQGVRIVFSARIVGGELGTLEVGGTTDFAEWRSLDDQEITQDSTTDIVGLAIEAWRARS